MMQVIEIQLPSFFNNFDPRAAAANFPSSNMFIILGLEHDVRLDTINFTVWELMTGSGIDIVSIWHIGVQAYLAGLTFALAASPCSTPVLASLLGYVAASRVHRSSAVF